jgi:hypothetical protein
VDVLLAGDHMRGGEALVGRGVGQPQPADDVADRVDVRLLRAHPAIDLDDPAVGLDAGRLESDVLDVGGPARRDEHHLGAQLGRLLAVRPDVQADPVVVGRDGVRVEAGAGHDRDPALLEAALDHPADLGVLERHDPGQVFEQRHANADVLEHRGEFDPDRARADDHDVLRKRVHAQDVVARDDPVAVRLEPGQRLDPRTRGEDHVGGIEHALAAGARRAVLTGLVDPDLLRAIEPAATLDPGDLVLGDEALEPGPHPLHDGIAASGHRGVVDLGLARQVEAELLGVADPIDEAGGLEQRLGRDAAAVQACAADLVLVDEGNLQPELGGAERRRVSAGARAEHDEIEVIGRADGHGSGASKRLDAGGWTDVREGPGGQMGHRDDGTRAVAKPATDGDRRRPRESNDPGRLTTRVVDHAGSAGR